MAEIGKKMLAYKIVINERSDVNITGVIDLISFDEVCVIADTEHGILVMKGTNLHVSHLNLDNGELSIGGEIGSIVYENSFGGGRGKSNFFSKIFK